MFKIGQQVVYSIHGVCKILELETKTVDKKLVEYYVLEPINEPGTRYYIPSGNEAAMSKLKNMLTKEQINELLHSDISQAATWIEDENQRKLRYREMLMGTDRAALIGMIRVLYAHRKKQMESGKKFHLCDENFLRDAQKVVGSEFSAVLGIPRDQVGEYIENELG